MPKLMKAISVISPIVTVTMALLYYYLGTGVFLTLAITFGTIFYHLGIRLLIGLLFNIFMNNTADYTKKWYKVHSWENKLYKFLRVNKWKGKLPTFNPDLYSLKDNSFDKIAQTMCQAELVHEVNCVISFLPLIASIWFGDFLVFLITSICAALFDLIFVIAQRYNRPRVIKLAELQKRRQQRQIEDAASAPNAEAQGATSPLS